MPIYVYRCESCGEEFEQLQKMSDPNPDTCPHCGKRHRIHRQVTAPAFRLVGNGWYETDFKSKGEKRYNLAGDADKPVTASKPAAGSAGGEPKSGTPASAAAD